LGVFGNMPFKENDMKLYGFPPSPNTRKVQATAAHLGIPLEFQFVDISKGQSRTPEFLAINPNGRTRDRNADAGRFRRGSLSALRGRGQVAVGALRQHPGMVRAHRSAACVARDQTGNVTVK
jgi:hypothetical protein